MIGAGVRERRKWEAKMSDNSVDDMVCKMREYLKGLGKCKPFTPDKHCNMRRNGKRLKPLPEAKGVYCFYEDGKPLYVGRTRNIRKRVLQHRRLRGRHNSAAFAFNIAKKDFEENHSSEKLSRVELSKDPEFDRLFTEAKERVRKMSVRFVEIKNPIEQTIFEVYAHIKLGTPFNDFDTH